MALGLEFSSVEGSQTAELVDGRRVHAEFHPGVGEPVVLLHGLLDSAAGWGEFAGASERPCVAFDLPGFGRSDLPSRSRISAYAQDIADAIDVLDLPDRFALVGHSLGGAVAAAVAELMPERVSSLVLLAPAGFGRIAVAEAVSVPGVRELVQLALPLALGHRLPLQIAYRAVITNNHAPPREILDRVTERAGALVPAARQATQAVVAAGRSQRAFHRRRLAYEGPVTALWGTSDLVVSPSHRAGVCTAFPHAKTVEWKGIGHHLQCEALTELVAFVTAACSDMAVHARPATAQLPRVAGPQVPRVAGPQVPRVAGPARRRLRTLPAAT